MYRIDQNRVLYCSVTYLYYLLRAISVQVFFEICDRISYGTKCLYRLDSSTVTTVMGRFVLYHFQPDSSPPVTLGRHESVCRARGGYGIGLLPA